MDERLKAAHTKLLELRTRTDLTLKPTPLLRETFTDFDGSEKPLKIRYYQVQGILHLVAMNRFLLGDDTGIGKCVVGDTRVLTDQGLVQIKHLRAASWDTPPEVGKFEAALPTKIWTGRAWAALKSWYFDGERPTLRLRSLRGFEVQGSHRHPVLVRTSDGERFVRLPDLVSDEASYVCIDRRFLAEEGRSDTVHWTSEHERVPFALDSFLRLRWELFMAMQRDSKAFHDTMTLTQQSGHDPTYRDLDELLATCADFGLTHNPDYQSLHTVCTNRYFYDRIESVEDAGIAPVMDIEVDDPDHSFVANGLVNHNTIQSIAALCFVWARDPDRKVIILTNKSLVGQWALEFEKFCTAGAINVFECTGTPAKREKIYRAFLDSTGPTVLILGYATARKDLKFLQDIQGHILITDEASAYKTPSTQTYQVVRHLGDPSRASRHWALTATLIKNNLMEGYGIYSLVVPGLFGGSKNKFMAEYALTRLQQLPGTKRFIPMIIGYRPDQIKRFREKIDPYFLSRAKFDVATELPVLTVREHKVGMTGAQEAKYHEALSGLLEIDKTGEEKETTKLTALIYCQQIVDHPSLVECEGDSEKMDALFDLLTDGDLAGEKIIVYSRFRKMVDLLQKTASEKPYKLKTVRVTGAEDEDERKEAMKRFQDPNSDVRVCWITDAAKEGINLQAAKALIFYDSPWSAGDYLQVLGRMVRIGSTHDRCYAIHLTARGTIDVQVMAVLRKKMQLIEQVMGRRIKGDQEEDFLVSTENSIDDLFAAMKQEARKLR